MIPNIKNKNMKTYIPITLLFFLCFISCSEEIPFDFKFEEQIFISGSIDDKTDYVSVQIQKTVSPSSDLVNSVNDAQVFLYSKDQDLNTTLLSDSFDIDEGVYTTSNKITPVIGNSYWIEVILEDGTILKSDEEIMKSIIQIKEVKRENNSIVILYDDPVEEDNFYIYHFDFLENNDVLTNRFMILINDSTFNGKENAEISIVDDYIKEGTTFKMSISNVSYTTYQYYSNLLSNQGEDEISLSTPANIIGNITNTNTNRRGLGNFSVSGFSSLSKEF